MFSQYTCFRINAIISGLMWFAIFMGLLIAFTMPANAQTRPSLNSFGNCAPVDLMLERLTGTGEKQAGEIVIWMLPNNSSPNQGGWTTFFANAETGSWTLTAIGPGFPNLMCTIQYGYGYGGVFPEGGEVPEADPASAVKPKPMGELL